MPNKRRNSHREKDTLTMTVILITMTVLHSLFSLLFSVLIYRAAKRDDENSLIGSIALASMHALSAILCASVLGGWGCP